MFRLGTVLLTNANIVRFWGQQTLQYRKLVSTPEGYWTFIYFDSDGGICLDDEYGYSFKDEIFSVGEKVSILEADDYAFTYLVVAIEDAAS